MHSIITFENVKLNGAMSIEIIDTSWTSDSIFEGVKQKSLRITHLTDGGGIYQGNHLVAKISRILPELVFEGATLSTEKNLKTPYFLGFEDRDDVIAQFVDGSEFFSDKEIVLAAKHMEDDTFGTLFIIVKDEKGKLLSARETDTLRTRSGPNRFYSEIFSKIDEEEKEEILECFFIDEYKDLLESILTHK